MRVKYLAFPIISEMRAFLKDVYVMRAISRKAVYSRTDIQNRRENASTPTYGKIALGRKISKADSTQEEEKVFTHILKKAH